MLEEIDGSHVTVDSYGSVRLATTVKIIVFWVVMSRHFDRKFVPPSLACSD